MLFNPLLPALRGTSVAACAVLLTLSTTALADDAPSTAVRPPVAAKGGDGRKIEFVLPFNKALEKATREKRLLFIKPIYGGVDARGAEDYRCGSW